MISPRKREAGPSNKRPPETLDVFYDVTRRTLVTAIQKRDQPSLRRAALRIEGERFASLSDGRQDEIIRLYREAASACGMGAS